MKINLGCGKDYRDGWINVDSDKSVKSDIQHDLNVFPYPFKDNTADLILSHHVIEHLSEPISHITECHRILKEGGKLILHYPHYSHHTAHFGFHKMTFGKDAFRLLADYGRDMTALPWSKYSSKLDVSNHIKLSCETQGTKGKPVLRQLKKLANWYINALGPLYERFPFLGLIFLVCAEVQVEIIK